MSNSLCVQITHELPLKSVLTKQKVSGRNVFMTHLRFLAVHCIAMDRCFASPLACIQHLLHRWWYYGFMKITKREVAIHKKLCYIKLKQGDSLSGRDFLCFRLLKWILITKRRAKNISHLATRQMCSLFLHSRITFGGKIEITSGAPARNLHKKYEVERKLIKIKAEKNWDVD